MLSKIMVVENLIVWLTIRKNLEENVYAQSQPIYIKIDR